MSKRTEDKIDDFLASQKEASEKKEHHIKLWSEWRDSGFTPEKFEPVLQAVQPTIQHHVQMLRAPAVSEAAMQAKAVQLVNKALRSYDPSKAALTTYLSNGPLKKLQRYNAGEQNVARIGEERIGRIGPVQRAYTELKDEFGRDPDHHEVAERVNQNNQLAGKRMAPMSVQDIQKTLASMRKDINASAFENDPTAMASSRWAEVNSLMPDHIANSDVFKKDRDKYMSLYNYTTGSNGMPKIDSNRELAKTLGITEQKASRMKTFLLNEYQRQVQGSDPRKI